MKKLTIFFARFLNAISGLSRVVAKVTRLTYLFPTPVENAYIFDRYVAIDDKTAKACQCGGVVKSGQFISHSKKTSEQTNTAFQQKLFNFSDYPFIMDDIFKRSIKCLHFYHYFAGHHMAVKPFDHSTLSNSGTRAWDLSSASYSACFASGSM